MYFSKYYLKTLGSTKLCEYFNLNSVFFHIVVVVNEIEIQ
jgi:hypothetical protein